MRNLFMSGGLVAALESEGLAGQSMTGEDAIAPNEDNTVVGAIAEIAEAEAEVIAANESIDEAEAVATDLEAIADVVGEAAEGDGLDEPAAEIMEVATESLMRRVGVPYARLGMPSTESFKSKAGRLAATQDSLEKFTDNVKKVWASIVEAIKRAINWAIELFNKYFDAATKINNRAKDLKSKVGKLSGSPTEKMVGNANLAKALSVAGKTAKPEDFKAVASTATSIYKAQEEVVKKLADWTIESDIPDIRPEQYGLKKSSDAQLNRVVGGDNIQVFSTPTMPGERVVFLALPDLTVAANPQDVAGKVRAGSTQVGEPSKADWVEVLSTSDVTAVTDTVVDITGAILKYREGLKKVNEAKKKYVSKLESFIRKESTGDSKDDKATAEKSARATALYFRKLMDEPASSFTSAAIRVAQAGLNYAESSSRAYEGSAEKK